MKEQKERRIPKYRILEIIKSGTIRERSELFLRDRLGYFQIDGINFTLEVGQPEEIMNSVKSKERQEWNKYLSYGLRLENGFRDLLRFYTYIENWRQSLERTLGLMVEFEEIEKTLNGFLLYRRTIDEASGKESSEDLIQMSREILGQYSFFLTRPEVTPEGNITLNLRKSDSGRYKCLLEKANREGKELRRWTTALSCFAVALRRKISESDIILPEYDEIVDSVLEWADERICTSGLRFEGIQEKRDGRIGHLDKIPTGFPYPAMRDLIEDYSVRPQDINLNEESELIKRFYNSI